MILNISHLVFMIVSLYIDEYFIIQLYVLQNNFVDYLIYKIINDLLCCTIMLFILHLQKENIENSKSVHVCKFIHAFIIIIWVVLYVWDSAKTAPPICTLLLPINCREHIFYFDLDLLMKPSRTRGKPIFFCINYLYLWQRGALPIEQHLPHFGSVNCRTCRCTSCIFLLNFIPLTVKVTRSQIYLCVDEEYIIQECLVYLKCQGHIVIHCVICNYVFDLLLLYNVH
jgi:hypothetical protein